MQGPASNPQEELAIRQLRQLLLVPEKQELERLERKLEDPEDVAKRIEPLIQEKIEALIIKYEKDIEETEKMTQPISPENSIGRVSRMDAINNKSVMEASLRNKISKRNKLKLALTQIDKPGFGACLNCKRQINPARLMFMPESTKCFNCADR